MKRLQTLWAKTYSRVRNVPAYSQLTRMALESAKTIEHPKTRAKKNQARKKKRAEREKEREQKIKEAKYYENVLDDGLGKEIVKHPDL